MQEKNYTALLNDGLINSASSKAATKRRMNALSFKNTRDLAFKEVPEYLRTPTGDELIKMRQWAIDYRKENKRASKRQVRKATQEHFKIKIYR